MKTGLKFNTVLNKPLKNTIDSLSQEFASIADERKSILFEIADFVKHKLKKLQKIELIFICTHNSRRSHISQIWAQTASYYYGIEDLIAYSGGTEATALSPLVVRAMQDVGFKFNVLTTGDNPIYEVQFSVVANEIIAFSKRYDSEANPGKGFAAIMTCSHADENCPVISGMERRISLPYNDPKEFDGTPSEALKYAESVREIGKEMLFLFSQVR